MNTIDNPGRREGEIAQALKAVYGKLDQLTSEYQSLVEQLHMVLIPDGPPTDPDAKPVRSFQSILALEIQEQVFNRLDALHAQMIELRHRIQT